mmetsp:Transcript_16657/g.23123  ORF Transcript_16657/g.23123 Transcript_16657/m.23123 type:complete len:513 (+) Transcript_16657:130-1668(+)
MSVMDVKVIGDYIVGKKLGEGTYGVVRLGIHSKTKKKVALKIVELKTEVGIKYLKREIGIMKLLHHPNIVKLYDVIEMPDRNKTCLVLEYVDGGELFDYILTREKLPESEAARLFRQIVSGLAYCHRNLVIHRDLKPENILLDSNRNAKITDFGMSNMMQPGVFLQSKCGSPLYAPPEILMQQQYMGPEVDTWALGVILYAMVTGFLPWEGSSLLDQVKNIVTGKYAKPQGVSDEFEDLLERMLSVDPKKRATLQEVAMHPWTNKGTQTFLSADLFPKRFPLPANKVDDEIMHQLEDLGFVRDQVLKDLLDADTTLQSVTMYYLMLDKKNQLKAEAKDEDERSSDSDDSGEHENGSMDITPNGSTQSLSDSRSPSNSSSKSNSSTSTPTTTRKGGIISRIFSKKDSSEGPRLRVVKSMEGGLAERITTKSIEQLSEQLEASFNQLNIEHKKKMKKGIVYSCKAPASKVAFELEICRTNSDAKDEKKFILVKRKKGELSAYKNVVFLLNLEKL